MTELEKKAIDVIRNHSHKLIDNFTQEDLENREISIFLAGYHEGNKANEWHYVKDGDLPKDRRNVWIVYLNGCYQKEETVASYRHKFWVISGHKTECDVLAWTELPKWEE